MQISKPPLSPTLFQRTPTPLRSPEGQSAEIQATPQTSETDPAIRLENQLNDVLLLGQSEPANGLRSTSQLSAALNPLRELTQSGANASSLEILRRFQDNNLPAAMNQIEQDLLTLDQQLANVPQQSPERPTLVLQRQVLLQSQALFQQAAEILADSPLLRPSVPTDSPPALASAPMPAREIAAPARRLLETLRANGQTASAEQLEPLLQNVSSRAQRRFAESFNALPPNQQNTALNMLTQLQRRPAPADLYTQLLALRNTLPAEGQMEVGKTLNALNLFLPNLTPTAPTSDDLSSRIERFEMPFYLGFSDPEIEIQNRFAQDLVALSGDLGFQVNLQVQAGLNTFGERMFPPENTRAELLNALGLDSPLPESQLAFFESTGEIYEWGEDDKMARQDGTLVYLPVDEQVDQAVAFTESFVRAETRAGRRSVGSQGIHTANLDRIDRRNILPTPKVQGAVASLSGLSAQELGAQFPQARMSQTYNEGGNTLIGTLPNGEAYAVVGYDSLVTSTRLLELRDPLRQPPIFTPAALAEQQSALGLDQPFAQLPQNTRNLIEDTAQRLNGGPVAPAQRDALRAQAIDFLSKMEITKSYLAEDMGISPERITFISQPDFHIDMQMRPMRPGEIMLNDYQANDDLLKAALELAEPGSWEAAELGRMRDRNRELGQLLNPVMREIEDQLQAAGLTVTRAPGVLESPPNNALPQDSSLEGALRDRQNIRYTNFMNAIPLTRPGSNQLVYLTNASSIAPLQSAYTAYLEREFGISEVHFIGGDLPPGSIAGPNTLNFAELSLRRMGGLDCREIRSLLQPFVTP